MHVLAPSLISAQSVGLFALLLFGLGWRCRQGRARVACLALGGLCTAFWLQAPKAGKLSKARSPGPLLRSRAHHESQNGSMTPEASHQPWCSTGSVAAEGHRNGHSRRLRDL